MSIDSHQNRLELLLREDPFLEPYRAVLLRRLRAIEEKADELTQGEMTLADFSSGHEYFGLHFRGGQWTFREWAPNATAVFLIGDISDWQEQPDLACRRVSDNGVWELRLPAERLSHGNLYRLRIHWPGGSGDRIPAWARRVVQDDQTLIFNAQVWQPETPYQWRHPAYRVPGDPPLIYEVHIGMAQQEGRVGSYGEFTANVLPRIKASGYNTLQIMGIPEHPYYGSFGYHVSSFFASSSRFGPPEALKALIDTAHGMGLTVLMDLVHSHAVNNEVEGLGRFDGTDYQYFHTGGRGRHNLWDSRLFDYAKPQVLHFLLSNCRYWLDEFKVDGFRFDGITSMLYFHHGMNKAFTSYQDYFDHSVDEAAMTYLALANRVIHDLRPDAVTIAEDVSGMPGLARSQEEGGVGFDYRFAMGVPDHWIKLTKDTRDEDWHMGGLWYELNNRRRDEKTISYAESHDQALVGDQTLIFRLIGKEMYDFMAADHQDLKVERGMALHKMIRLITLATAGHGYLNFMGNEFGHPEWIDFPRQGNNWSYHYARRQWHLADDTNLKYRQLDRFDKAMIAMSKKRNLLSDIGTRLLWERNDHKVIIFERAQLVLAFNFHPVRSYSDYRFPASPGRYRIVLNSDDIPFGGHGRVDNRQEHVTVRATDQNHLSLYLPSRTALVLMKPNDCSGG
ncbi:MAG: alpha amylase C-terminal domain-containing protein [Desulfobacteraceae bacterium]|jgi:1,4-alpha-glucan branching enzyme